MADVTGHWLAWKNQPSQTFLTDYYIRVPYFNKDKVNTYIREVGSGTELSPLSGGATCINANPLYMLSKIWAFMYDWTEVQTSPCAAGYLQSGSMLYPDNHGNYIPFLIADATQTARNFDEQKVGKLVYIDHRYPKQSLDYVDTFPGSGAGAGTETGGLPWHAFTFAKDLLLLAGVALTSRTIEDIVDMFVDGTFGMAHIQLHVS